MSIIQTLTEGIVNRDMKKEGSALLSKWTKTGLLEGLQNEQQKHTMARLLENQAKELLRESSSMGAGDVEGFAAVAFPIVRRVFAGLIANDLVSVQPMSLPSGLIFFLDFTYGNEIGATGTRTSGQFGHTNEDSIYGGNQVGKGVLDGVDLVDSTTKADASGMRGMTGYAYSSPSGSQNGDIAASAATAKFVSFALDGAVTETHKKYIQYDPDLLSIADASRDVVVIDINKGLLLSDEGLADFDNLSAFIIAVTDMATDLGGACSGVTTMKQVRRLTNKVATADSMSTLEAIRFVFSIAASESVPTAESQLAHAILKTLITFPVADSVPVGGSIGSVQSASTLYALENEANIPEIDIKVDSIAITAQTKKLKAKWTPELGQDLNAYHNLDAEVELTSILSEQIALEIDREILADLVNGAKAGTFYWSRSPGLFVNRVTGAEIGQTSAAPDFTGTVSEWYETLIETMNDVSAQIHRKTLRGGANFCVVSPEVANVLEFTAGFRANVTADADKGEIGAVKIGSLSRKFDVIVDPYFPRNVILMGRKGSSFLESGYVYAPYIPLQVTPTIFGVEDFVPRKGVMTRYAKKMVRPDMYGIVIVRGLLGEAGATS